MRILLVEDDRILADILRKSLNAHNYIVDIAEDGLLGWNYFQSGEYDLVLLDVGLPSLNGIGLCQKLRAAGYTTPVLLMTAHDASQERIRGLDAGADDYLVKPLDLDELHARIRALSRRGIVVPNTVLEINGLKLDPISCQVSYRSRPIELTPKEYNLLELFLRNPSRVFSRTQILDRIWTFDDSPLEESVKAHIKGLRKKLKEAGVVGWIENVYGIGYRLNPQVSAAKPLQQIAQPASPVPSNSLKAEFNRKLEAMWLQYQGLMSERMKVLHAAVASVEQRQLSPQLQESAANAAHKLAGVLGMFNRETGTQLARDIENLLRENEVLFPVQQELFLNWVKDLKDLLALDPESKIEPPDFSRLLLIAPQSKISEELQYLAKGVGMSWQRCDNLDRATEWLQENLPHLVVIDLDAINDRSSSLNLIAELTARTPSIPTLVLSALDCLQERIEVARWGASGFLVKPLTARKIWDNVTNLIRINATSTTNILVVDDNPMFSAGLRLLVEPWGIRLTTLEHPVHFWEILRATRPDLLILDVNMPEINGIEICRAIRNDSSWQALPILFLTVSKDADTIQKVFAAGADDYLTKPIVGEELLTRINNRLKRNRLLQTLGQKNSS
jgi:DNA-binding response OmpR family regulator